ncbi:F-box protein-like protein [Tanacetum coccineum]
MMQKKLKLTLRRHCKGLKAILINQRGRCNSLRTNRGLKLFSRGRFCLSAKKEMTLSLLPQCKSKPGGLKNTLLDDLLSIVIKVTFTPFTNTDANIECCMRPQVVFDHLQKKQSDVPLLTHNKRTERIPSSSGTIQGWDQGLLGMCAEEKCKSKIPSKIGYRKLVRAYHMRLQVESAIRLEPIQNGATVAVGLNIGISWIMCRPKDVLKPIMIQNFLTGDVDKQEVPLVTQYCSKAHRAKGDCTTLMTKEKTSNRERGTVASIRNGCSEYKRYPPHGPNDIHAENGVTWERLREAPVDKYPPHGPNDIHAENGVTWERLREAPVDKSPHDLHI